MKLLVFNQTYSVGIETMDEQHAALFSCLNELQTSLLRGESRSVTGCLVDDLVAYARTHCSAEEAMLAHVQFPGLEKHRAIHLELNSQVAAYVARYKRGETILSAKLLKFFCDWLANHITHQDRAYATWSSTLVLDLSCNQYR